MSWTLAPLSGFTDMQPPARETHIPNNWQTYTGITPPLLFHFSNPFCEIIESSGDSTT